MRFVIVFLVALSAFIYVLFDSRALEFDPKVVDSNELIAHQGSSASFHPERLEGYFNKLVSKIGK